MFRVITAIFESGGRHPQTCSLVYLSVYLGRGVGEEGREVMVNDDKVKGEQSKVYSSLS